MAYKYIAGGTALPIAQVDEGDVHTRAGLRRDGIRVTLEGMPTAKQLKALTDGRIVMKDERDETQYAFEGYTEALSCEVTLARPDEAEVALAAANAQASALARLAAAIATDEQALAHAESWPAWQAGAAYEAGDVVRHGEGLYRVAQAHAAQAHRPPDSAGLLAVYRPLRATALGEMLPWLSGEALAIGDLRMYGGIVYEAYAAAGANVHVPPEAPAVWREVD